MKIPEMVSSVVNVADSVINESPAVTRTRYSTRATITPRLKLAAARHPSLVPLRMISIFVGPIGAVIDKPKMIPRRIVYIVR